MKNISIQVFGTEETAEAHAQKERSKKGQEVCGPTQLGTVSVIDRTGGEKGCFRNFAGKWGIEISF